MGCQASVFDVVLHFACGLEALRAQVQSHAMIEAIGTRTRLLVVMVLEMDVRRHSLPDPENQTCARALAWRERTIWGPLKNTQNLKLPRPAIFKST